MPRQSPTSRKKCEKWGTLSHVLRRNELQRNIDCDGDSRMLPVVHVVSVVDVVNIDIVSPVPGGRPGFRAGINHAEPVAAVLETRVAFDYYDRYLVDAEPVSAAEVGVEAIVRNAVSVVSAAIVPGAVLALPIMRTLALPDVLPYVARSVLVSPYLAKLYWTMRAIHVTLRFSMEGLMGLARLLVMMFRAISGVVAGLRLRRMHALVLVRVTLLSVRAALFMTSRPAVLSAGKARCCQ